MSSTDQKYLTKRLLANKSTQAFKEAYEEAMETLGYVIMAKDGWVIKKYDNGEEEKMEKIQPASEVDGSITALLD